MSLEDDVRQLIDRQAVVDVLHLYCTLVDSHQMERLVQEVYAENATNFPGVTTVTGRAALLEWYKNAVKHVQGQLHLLSNIFVDVQGDKATTESSAISWGWMYASKPQGPRRPADWAVVTVYRDELSKYPEGWRIDHRVCDWNGISKVAVGSVPDGHAYAPDPSTWRETPSRPTA
jgi:hypothetical protein